jgi:hypothetical protein
MSGDNESVSWTHSIRDDDTMVVQVNCICGLPILVIDPDPVMVVGCECGHRYTLEMPDFEPKLTWREKLRKLWLDMHSGDWWLERL